MNKETYETTIRIQFEMITELSKKVDDLENIIKEAREYIEDRFFINEETGEYCLTHTFDKSNLYELLKILKEYKV